MWAAVAADLRYDLAQREGRLGVMNEHEAATIVVSLGSLYAALRRILQCEMTI